MHFEPLVVSEAVFQDQSDADQTAILAAGKTATEVSADFLRKQEEVIKTELVSRGMEISDPADNEAEFIKLATEAVWPQFYQSIGGVEKLNEVLTALGRDPVK